MELRDYLRILRDRWVSVVLIVLLGLAIAAGSALITTPQYTSSTRIFFAVQGSESVADLAQGSSFAEQQMSSYIEVANSPLVLDPVIDSLDLDTNPQTLAQALDFTIPDGTVVLEISATNTDPGLARDIADAVADSLSSVAGGMSPDQPDGTETVRATVLSEAVAASSPSSPMVARNLSLGAALGLIIGIGVAMLRHAFDTRVRNDSDVSNITDLGILARVPSETAKARQHIFIHQDARGVRAEAIRRLRTNLQFVDFSDRPNSIVVTSSIQSEGKSTTAINLAVALADAGSRVILVDADLRRPSVARYLGLEGKVGLTTVLSGRATIVDVTQPWQDSGLEVLPSGQMPPNPSELLGSGAMAKLVSSLETNYDMVIFDSAPLLPVTDAAILSRMVGGVLLVAGADTLHKGQMQLSLESLENVEARTLGVVLNKIERNSRTNYYEEYYGPEVDKTQDARRRSKPPSYKPRRVRARRAK